MERKEKMEKDIGPTKEELLSYSLKITHYIVLGLDKETLSRLSFGTFDMVYKKVQEAPIDGFIEGLLVAYKPFEG